jgi:hypothetical protein
MPGDLRVLKAAAIDHFNHLNKARRLALEANNCIP